MMPGGVPPQPSPAQIKEMLQAAANEVAAFLRAEYPEVGHDRIMEAAQAAAGEIPAFREIYSVIANHSAGLENLAWEVMLCKKRSLIVKAGNEDDEIIASFAAPVSMGVAATLGPSVIMTCSHITGMTRDPVQRAELYLFGYYLRFALGVRGKAPAPSGDAAP